MNRRRELWLGLTVLGVVIAIAVLGPLLAPHGETEYVGLPNSGRLADAPFGTDHLGQDVWSRFLLGGRSIVVTATLATALGVLAGAAIGLVAASARGVRDELLMRANDVLLGLPAFLLVLVAMTTVGPEPWLVVGMVAIAAAPRVARVTRGAAVAVVDLDFVRISEAMGESSWRIMRSDVLPNIAAPLLVEASVRFAYSIGIVASLAFLGFTPEVNGADWGVMVQENRAALTVQPWGVVLPVMAIAALAVGTALVADAIARVTSGRDPA